MKIPSCQLPGADPGTLAVAWPLNPGGIVLGLYTTYQDSDRPALKQQDSFQI
jgi:hypothetical protein